MAETMVAWGVKSVFGMVGHSNLGLADALRLREADGEMSYFGVRHEGAASFRVFRLRQAHRQARGVSGDRGSGRDQSV